MEKELTLGGMQEFLRAIRDEYLKKVAQIDVLLELGDAMIKNGHSPDEVLAEGVDLEDLQ